MITVDFMLLIIENAYIGVHPGIVMLKEDLLPFSNENIVPRFLWSIGAVMTRNTGMLFLFFQIIASTPGIYPCLLQSPFASKNPLF